MKAKLKKINQMSREEAVEYLKAVHLSSVSGRERTVLLETCESRINSLDRDGAIIVKAEFDD